MDVSVIIVNYNTKKDTIDCIKSVEKYTKNIVYEIIVVDNASTDGSVPLIKESFPNVNVISSDKNLGFGKANNLGITYAQGDYIFLLNSDTLLLSNSIEGLFKFHHKFEKILNIGVLGCTLKDANGDSNYSGGKFPTPFSVLFDMIRHYMGIKKDKSNRIVSVNEEAFIEVEMVTGADLFLKKSLFNSAGKFDENFFMYYEESDLQKRIKKLGFKNYLLKEFNIIHLDGVSFKKVVKNRQRIITQKSKNLYFKKNFKNYPIYVFFDFLMNFVRIFNRKYSLIENFHFITENIKSY